MGCGDCLLGAEIALVDSPSNCKYDSDNQQGIRKLEEEIANGPPRMQILSRCTLHVAR